MRNIFKIKFDACKARHWGVRREDGPLRFILSRGLFFCTWMFTWVTVQRLFVTGLSSVGKSTAMIDLVAYLAVGLIGAAWQWDRMEKAYRNYLIENKELWTRPPDEKSMPSA